MDAERVQIEARKEHYKDVARQYRSKRNALRMQLNALEITQQQEIKRIQSEYQLAIEQLQGDYQGASKQVQALEEQIKQIRERGQGNERFLNAECEQLRLNAQSADSKLQERQKDLMQGRTELAHAQEEQKELEKQLKVVKKANEKNKRLMKRYRAERDELRVQSKAQVDGLRRDLHAEPSRSQEAAVAQRKQIKAIKEELADLHTEHKRVQNELQTHQHELTRVQAEQQKSTQEVKQRARDHQQQELQLQQIHDDHQASLIELKKQLGQAQEEKQNMKQRAKKYRNERNELREALTRQVQLKDRVRQLDKKLQDAQKAQNGLKKSARKYKKQRDALKGEIDQSRASHSNTAQPDDKMLRRIDQIAERALLRSEQMPSNDPEPAPATILEGNVIKADGQERDQVHAAFYQQTLNRVTQVVPEQGNADSTWHNDRADQSLVNRPFDMLQQWTQPQQSLHTLPPFQLASGPHGSPLSRTGQGAIQAVRIVRKFLQHMPK